MDWRFVNEVFLNIALVMALPVFLSRVLLHFWPWLADFAKYKIAPHALWAWSVMLLILGGMARTTFDKQEISAVTILLQIGCATLAVCILNFFVGWLIGPRRCKLESSQLLGQKNTAMGIWMSNTYLQPLSSVFLAFYIIWQNLFNSLQLWWHDRRISN
jgi:BASS family bile acid:Na+ symporter